MVLTGHPPAAQPRRELRQRIGLGMTQPRLGEDPVELHRIGGERLTADQLGEQLTVAGLVPGEREEAAGRLPDVVPRVQHSDQLGQFGQLTEWFEGQIGIGVRGHVRGQAEEGARLVQPPQAVADHPVQQPGVAPAPGHQPRP